jgi:L-arabinose isomerase
MGDFQAEEEALLQLGIETKEISPDDLTEATLSVTDEAIAEEIERDRRGFRMDVDPEVHRRTTRLCLGVRKYLEEGAYHAFSMNFLAFNSAEEPISTVPFLECSKAMSRGLGYAGEGDVLTASLVGALQTAFGDTSFTEIFCPDWKGGTLFLSHMGEFNPDLAARKPRLYEKEFPFTPARNPAVITCSPKPGPATLVNLAPGPKGVFHLIASRVEILEDGAGPGIEDWLRAWIRPQVKLEEFLECYSEFGGTHHSALMLGDRYESLVAFASMAGVVFLPLE